MNAKELNLDLYTIAEKFVSLTQDEWFAKEEIEHIRLALTELADIKKRAEEERVKAMGFIADYKHLNDIAICQSETDYNNRHIHKLTDDLELIDFIIKGEGK